MLKAMRTGAKSMVIKGVLFGLLLLAMLGLAVTDVQGMFRGGVSNTTVAKIGREKISTTELRQMVDNALRNQPGMSEEIAYAAGLPRMLLDQEIQRRIIQRQAGDLGVIVDNKTAASEVKNILSPIVGQGMSEAEALQRILQAYNLSESRFVSMIRSEMAAKELMKAITSGARAPRQLVDSALKHRYEWRQGSYFTLTADDAGEKFDPSEDELKKHYDSIAPRFAQPETRSFAVLVLDKKTMGLDGKIGDDVLKQYYDDNIAEFTAPERRRISQLVVKDEAEAKALFEKAKASKDLKKSGEAATKAKKANYILGTYAENDLPEDFAAQAFDAAKGAVMEPVKSALGWHILHVEDIIPSAVRPFEEVKGKIATTIAEEKTADLLYDRANEVDDMLAGGAGVAEVAEKYKLTPVAFTKVDAGGFAEGKKIEGVPSIDKLLKEVFDTDESEATQLVETPEGAYVVAFVTAIQPSANEPFEKVRAQVMQDLRNERAARLVDEKAAKLIERLQLGESLDKIAAEAGKKVVKTDLVQRADTSDKAKALPRGMQAALFSLDKIGQSTTVSGEGATVHILSLSSRKVDVPKEPSKEDLDNLTASLNRSLQNDIIDQFSRSLQDEYNVSINEKTLTTMFVPKTEELQ